jgi:hypothetical protein
LNKRILLIVLAFCFTSVVFTQQYNYGLNDEDIKLLLGVLVEQSEGQYIWSSHTFSWGHQKTVGGNAITITIDYNKSIACLWGLKYENYLTIVDTGIAYVIKNVTKVASGKYLMHLIFVGNSPRSKPKDAGILTVTYLDAQHVLIDNVDLLLSSFNLPGMLWKCSGPTVREKFSAPDLPDAEL